MGAGGSGELLPLLHPEELLGRCRPTRGLWKRGATGLSMIRALSRGGEGMEGGDKCTRVWISACAPPVRGPPVKGPPVRGPPVRGLSLGTARSSVSKRLARRLCPRSPCPHPDQEDGRTPGCLIPGAVSLASPGSWARRCEGQDTGAPAPRVEGLLDAPSACGLRLEQPVFNDFLPHQQVWTLRAKIRFPTGAWGRVGQLHPSFLCQSVLVTGAGSGATCESPAADTASLRPLQLGPSSKATKTRFPPTSSCISAPRVPALGPPAQLPPLGIAVPASGSRDDSMRHEAESSY